MTAFGNTDEVFDLVKTGAIVKMNLCYITGLNPNCLNIKFNFEGFRNIDA